MPGFMHTIYSTSGQRAGTHFIDNQVLVTYLASCQKVVRHSPPHPDSPLAGSHLAASLTKGRRRKDRRLHLLEMRVAMVLASASLGPTTHPQF